MKEDIRLAWPLRKADTMKEEIKLIGVLAHCDISPAERDHMWMAPGCSEKGRDAHLVHLTRMLMSH